MAAIMRLPPVAQYVIPLSALPRHLADVILISFLRRNLQTCQFLRHFQSPHSKVDTTTKSLVLSAEDYWWFSFIFARVSSTIPGPAYSKLLADYLTRFTTSLTDKRRCLYLQALIADLWLSTDCIDSPQLLSAATLAIHRAKKGPLFSSSLAFLKSAVSSQARSSTDPQIACGLIGMFNAVAEIDQGVESMKLLPALLSHPTIQEYVVFGSSATTQIPLSSLLPSSISTPQINPLQNDLRATFRIALSTPALPTTLPLFKSPELTFELWSRCSDFVDQTLAESAGIGGVFKPREQNERALLTVSESATSSLTRKLKIQAVFGTDWHRPVGPHECGWMIPLTCSFANWIDRKFLGLVSVCPVTTWPRFLASWWVISIVLGIVASVTVEFELVWWPVMVAFAYSVYRWLS